MRFELHLPAAAKAVLAGPDAQGVFCIWFELEPSADRYFRQFITKGTGQAIESDLKHVISYAQDPFIWHLYEAPLVVSPSNSTEASHG